MFTLTAIKVITMIAYGVPGYLLIKTKALGEDSIKAFAKMLLYVCQPALAIYSLTSVEKTPKLLGEMGIFFGLTLASQVVIIGLYFLIFNKKIKSDLAHRVCAVAGVCGNVGFFGIPLLEYLLPEHPEVTVYSLAFSTSMNLIGWTLGLVMMTGDKKYIRIKSVFINPSMLSVMVAFPLFFFEVRLPGEVLGFIETLGRMSTVVCMTVLGMRLATKKLSSVFTNPKVYIAAVSKLFIVPIVIGLLFRIVPVSETVRSAAFILGCCPGATMLQSLAETHKGDSKTAADIVLSTSLMCIITIPIMWSVYNLIVR